MQQTLSPRDFAQALGVSESSIKRWADEGRIQASRTAGGHRRISIAEAVRFVHKTQVPVADPKLLQFKDVAALENRLPAPGREAEELYGYLKDGDRAQARGLIEGLYLGGWSIAKISDGPIREVMRRLGEDWEHRADEGIFWEHRATEICIQSMHHLMLALTPEANAPVAVGGAPEGDPYILSSLIAAVVLTEEGWRAVNLGPQTPLNALRVATHDLSPDLVWLSFGSEPESEKDREEARKGVEELQHDLRGRRISLVVGGRRVPEIGRLPGVARCETMAEMAAFARGLKAARDAVSSP